MKKCNCNSTRLSDDEYIVVNPTASQDAFNASAPTFTPTTSINCNDSNQSKLQVDTMVFQIGNMKAEDWNKMSQEALKLSLAEVKNARDCFKYQNRLDEYDVVVNAISSRITGIDFEMDQERWISGVAGLGAGIGTGIVLKKVAKTKTVWAVLGGLLIGSLTEEGLYRYGFNPEKYK